MPKPQIVVSRTTRSKAGRIARADGAPGELLGGRGEAVEEIAADAWKKFIRIAFAASTTRRLRALRA